MRNLTKTIAAVSILAPASAYPLGIGDIKLHSSLNQNLDAEIALILSAGENISDISVRLAPPEKFDEAGVPWNYFLSKIKFDSITKADGSTVVKVSSKEAIREPFLDFLLEVRWAKGNLYREFTVLIDPPTAYTQPIIPIVEKAKQIAEVKPAVKAKPVVKVKSVNKTNPVKEIKSVVKVKPVPENKPIRIEVIESANVTQQARDNKPAGSVESKAKSKSESGGKTGQYGPTKRKDSLWKIAKQTNVYDDVSLEQMMLAIYKANPKAFYKDNINALKTNKTLKIPEKEIILKLSKRKAISEFRRQDKVWKGQVLAAAKTKQSVIAKKVINTQLELKAPVEAEISDKTLVVSKADVLLGNKAKFKSRVKNLVARTSEEKVAAQARLDKLERKLEKLQKMLVLRDEQIATLQNREKLATATAAAAKFSEAQAKLTSKEIKPESIKPVRKSVEAAAVTAAAVVQPEIKNPAGIKPAAIDPVAKNTAKAVIKPKPKPKPKPKVNPVVQPPVAESGFMSGSMSLIIGGLGTGIIGLLGWLWWRKRKLEDRQSESMFAGASEISLPDSSEAEELTPATSEDSSSYDVGTVGESSFLSEFTPSDFDAFDIDQNEVDPISEADVYLAYGRYQQAEDLMRQAISEQPDRDECKLKLLEIFYANENKDAFEEFAKELVSSGKHEDEGFWPRVVEMGTELDPECTLYTGDASKHVSAKAEISSENNEVTDIVNDSSENHESISMDTDSADIDLSVFDEENSDPVSESNEVVEEKNDQDSLDFDLSAFDVKEAETATTATVEISKTEEIETLDFDLNTDTTETAEVDASESLDMAMVSESESTEIEYELGAVEVESESESAEIEYEASAVETESVADSAEIEYEPAVIEMESVTDSPEIEYEAGAIEIESESESAEIENKAGAEEIEPVSEFAEIEAVESSDENIAEISLTEESESLDDFDFSADSSSTDVLATETAENELLTETETFDEFDLDADATPAVSETDDEIESDVSDLTDLDELETKIDLAKAYIDMGDIEAAKDIVEEVKEKGSPEQKEAAQDIIDQLKSA